MNWIEAERLFGAVDDTTHEYVWDYTTIEKAVALFDVNEEYFAVITKRREIAEETSGTQGGDRDNTYHVWNLYPKNNLKPGIEPVEKWGMGAIWVFDDKIRNMVDVGKECLMSEVKKKPYGTGIKELESITLGLGRVYIQDGSVMLDRVQG